MTVGGVPNCVGCPRKTDPVGVTDWPMIGGAVNAPLVAAGAAITGAAGGGATMTGGGPALTGLAHDEQPTGAA